MGVGFLIMSLIKIEPALLTIRKELKNLDKKIAEVRQSTFELERLGSYLKSDAYFERQARLKLNYKKPDEKVVYIYTTETQNGAEILKKDQTIKKSLKNWQRWWQYLFE